VITPIRTSIVIPPGSTNGTVTLTAVQDTLDELNETIIVDISSVTNGHRIRRATGHRCDHR